MALPSALFPPISAPCRLCDSGRETSALPRRLLPRKAHPVNNSAPTQLPTVAQRTSLLVQGASDPQLLSALQPVKHLQCIRPRATC